MDTEEPSSLTPEQSRLVLFEHLYSRFESCGHKNFQFVIKNVASSLGWNSQRVSISLKKLRKNNLVVLSERRPKRCLWKTNFENKTKEEIRNAII
jgi:hypothetical protein